MEKNKFSSFLTKVPLYEDEKEKEDSKANLHHTHNLLLPFHPFQITNNTLCFSMGDFRKVWVGWAGKGKIFHFRIKTMTVTPDIRRSKLLHSHMYWDEQCKTF